MQMMTLARVGLLSAFGALFAMGCGGDGDSGPKSYVGESTMFVVKAGEAASGEVGAVKIDVPKGALAEDTEITIKVEDKKGYAKKDEDLPIDVYEFGPDGLQFNAPVTLTFDLAGVNLKNKKADIVYQDDDGNWVKLDNTKVEGGKAKADTTHFTPFTIMLTLTDDGDLAQGAGQCANDFTACGGDLTGTWEFTGSCATIPEGAFGGSDPDSPFNDCTDKPTAGFSIDITGTITFNADGTYEGDQTLSVQSTVSIPKSCLTEVAMGEPFTCDDLNGDSEPQPGEPVFTDSGDACVQTGSFSEVDNGGGTWTTEGGRVYLDEGATGDATSDAPAGGTSTVDTGAAEGGGAPAPAPREAAVPGLITKQSDPAADEDIVEYCVKGDTLTVRHRGSEGEVMGYTAKRK